MGERGTPWSRGVAVRIEIITVGAVREPFLREGVEEYLRRLRRYAPVSLRAVPEAHLPPGAGEAEVEQARTREGEELLRVLGRDAYAVALDREGVALDSEGLAAWLADLAGSGAARVAFVVGGPRGLARSVLARADFRLSLSRLTFTHEMSCLILLEQLYRAFRIHRREPYHY